MMAVSLSRHQNQDLPPSSESSDASETDVVDRVLPIVVPHVALLFHPFVVGIGRECA
jgi:hypothetical protein